MLWTPWSAGDDRARTHKPIIIESPLFVTLWFAETFLCECVFSLGLRPTRQTAQCSGQSMALGYDFLFLTLPCVILSKLLTLCELSFPSLQNGIHTGFIGCGLGRRRGHV